MQTHLDGEENCLDYGKYQRNGLVFHKATGELIPCKADIPDTMFSVPSCTANEHGSLGLRKDGEWEFAPAKIQVGVKEFLKRIRSELNWQRAKDRKRELPG